MLPLKKLIAINLTMLLVTASELVAFETVVIDPGHGGNDQGSQWYHIKEKDLTMAVAKRLEAALNVLGINTVMTRRYDCYVGLDERATMANRIPNSLLVSIHFNASSAQSIGGYQSIYQGESSKLIARSIQDAMTERISSRDRGVTKQNLAVLMRTWDCSVLIECGFLSNKAESARLHTAEGEQLLAECIATGIVRVKPIINYDFPVWEIAEDGTPALVTRAQKKAAGLPVEPLPKKPSVAKSSPSKKSKKKKS